MNIRILAEVLLVIFAISIVVVEIIRKTVSPATSWISTYLTGPYSWIEDIGFVALFVALELFPHILNTHGLVTIIFTVAGIGVLMTMVSDKFFPSLFPSLPTTTISLIHRISAGIAFTGATFGLMLVSASTLDTFLLSACLAGTLWLYIGAKNGSNGQMVAEKLLACGITLIAFLRLKDI